MEALCARFSSHDFKWRLRQLLSARKQGACESSDSYIEFINSTCQSLGAPDGDRMQYFAQGLYDDIKREVLVQKPDDYQTTENLARLKVSGVRAITEKVRIRKKISSISFWTSKLQNLLNQQVITNKKLHLSSLLTDLLTNCQRNSGCCAQNSSRCYAMRSDPKGTALPTLGNLRGLRFLASILPSPVGIKLRGVNL